MEIQWSLVIFTALTGAAGWMLACIAADEFLKKAPAAAFKAALVAIVLLAVGGLASVTHLSHPENIMGALGHPTSGIFIEICLVGLTGVFALAYLVACKREAGASARKALAVLAAVFGVVLSFMAGHSYVMASQPAWNSLLLPVGYLGTAIPAGVACYLVCAALFGDEGADLGQYAKLLLAGGAVALVSAALYGLLCGNLAAAAAPFALCLVFSGAVPAVCGVLIPKRREQLKTLAGAAAASAVVGAVCYRICMWMVAAPIANFFGQL